MKKQRGRPIMAAIFGFLSGLFLSITLLAFGVIPLESFFVVFLPVLGLILAFVLAMWAPIGGGGTPPPAATPPATPPPPETDAGSV